MNMILDHAPTPAVRDRGVMTAEGWKPENGAWLDVLAPRGENGRVGGNPMALAPDVLTASGHPPAAKAMTVVGRMRAPIGKREDGEPWRFTNLRNHCRGCAENAAEVRRCACIECPLWPYRLGKNPHHPGRGKQPKNLPPRAF